MRFDVRRGGISAWALAARTTLALLLMYSVLILHVVLRAGASGGGRGARGHRAHPDALLRHPARAGARGTSRQQLQRQAGCPAILAMSAAVCP